MLIRELFPEVDDSQFKKILSSSHDLHLNTKVNLILDIESYGSFIDREKLGNTQEKGMFYELIYRFVKYNKRWIEQVVIESLCVDESDIGALVLQIVDEQVTRLSEFYLRPLIAHIKKISDRGDLCGGTPEERYVDYCHRWYVDFIDDFYENYPLIKYIHNTLTSQFYVTITEIFERIHTHKNDICMLLGVDSLLLESMYFVGDRHNGGRTGCVLMFRQGTVMYKSRSIGGEQAYYNIIQKLTECGAPVMRAARVIDGDGYGFMEFIEREEVDFSSNGFLESSGCLAALFYALHMKDMHEENLIPSANGPIPIDLETMLSPLQILSQKNLEISNNAAAIYLKRSISSSCLLPTRIRRRSLSQGYIDIGFIQGKQGVNPFAHIAVENLFRDDALVQFTREDHHGLEAVPFENFGLEEADEQRHLEATRASAFAQGFAQMYRWICENRQAVLDIVRTECTGITLRVVLQPTVRYGQLMRMLGNPEALASEDIFTTIMFRTAVFAPNRPIGLITAEVESLRQLDIPFFKHQADHTEILSPDGNPVAGLKSHKTALEEVLIHITNMSEEDLAEQLNQIWSSFVSPYPATLSSTLVDGKHPQASSEHIRLICVQLVQKFISEVHPGSTDKAPWTWVAPIPGTEQQHTGAWDIAVLGLDLYSGSLGPALALAQAAHTLGDDSECAQTAHHVFDPIVDVVLSGDNSLIVPKEIYDAALMGEPGIAFALAGTAECLNDPRLKEAAAVLGNRTAERLAQAEHPSPDYLTGQVGAAALLLGYDLADDREALLGVLDRHAQDIIAGHVEEEWWSHSGFAHGISASIFALSRWNQQMPSEERAQHAVKILLDRLREFDNGESWESQISRKGSRGGVWCHGTAGISLALAAVQAWMPELSTRADLERAVHHALHEGTGRNLTYCHGDLGTLDILEWVVNHVPDLPDAEKIRDILANGYSTSLLQETLEDKSVRYSLTPSYMVGTSGVLSWLARRIGGTRLYTPIIPDSTEA